MASNAILATLAHLVACSPCGRWKAELQDDDADLWNDLTFVNAIPDVKPPDIPKVVEVVSCSDGSDEDVSTLAYESYYHSHHIHYSSPRRTRNNNSAPKEEEKSFTPSPKRSEVSLRQEHSFRDTTYRDPELEQVFEEIGGGEDSGDSDAELESIMGPRSQLSMARSHISRSIKRASSAPVVAGRPISLLQQQQREHYQSPSLERHYSDSPSVTKGNSEDDRECRDNFNEAVPLDLGRSEVDCCDGSSYSSVNQKISFFKRKRISLFRGSSNGSNCKKAGGWLPLEHNESSTEDTTVSTTTSKPKGFHRSHSRLKFKPFH